MPLPELVAALEREASLEREDVLETARREAERVRLEGERTRSRRRLEALAELEEELREEARSRLATARREARRRLLEARASVIATVLEAARRRLEDGLEDERCRRALPAVLASALERAEPGELVVRCPSGWERDVERWLEEREGQAPRDVEVRADAGLRCGVVVETASRRLEVAAGALAALDARRRHLEVALVSELRRLTGFDVAALSGAAGPPRAAPQGKRPDGEAAGPEPTP